VAAGRNERRRGLLIRGVAAVYQVPSSLAGLLSLLRGCFTQPTFETFSMLLIGMVGRVRDCTVTGMLQAAGLSGEWHHSRAHDFFARSRWDPDQLGVLLVDFLVTVFVNAGPIRLAVDDTFSKALIASDAIRTTRGASNASRRAGHHRDAGSVLCRPSSDAGPEPEK
jgi:DDE superfamily endonuclease